MKRNRYLLLFLSYFHFLQSIKKYQPKLNARILFACLIRLMISKNSSPRDLLDRLILFEKLIELKSNECAYYRTKVHLMQMNSSKEIQQSSSSSEENSSEIINHIPGKSILKKTLSHSSIPFRTSNKSQRRCRLEINHQTSAQNRNAHSIPLVVQDKNIQCTDKDFHSIESSLQTILKLRLPHRFIRSLHKSSSSRLKVHLSAQLLNKLFQSMHSIDAHHFTIQSQFGKISACIDQKQQRRGKTAHAKAEVKMHSNDQLPVVRHLARKCLPEKTHRNNSSKYRSKKKHVRKSSSISNELSKRCSTTNPSQTTETRSSTDQTSNSIIIDNTKQKNRRRNHK